MTNSSQSQERFSAAQAITEGTPRVLETTGKAAPAATTRIAALDFTKGALVLFMVLYHWLNYFLGPGGISYRFLRFLPPSFIFITGFLVSNVYLARYAATDSRIPKRLSVRALKILGVFIVLNLAIAFLVTGIRNLNASSYLSVFVLGNVHIVGIGKVAAFSILVPISYLLLLSAVLLVPYRSFKHTFHFVLATFVIGIVVLSALGYRSNNLEMVSVGLLGLILGFGSVDEINSYVRHPYILGVAYAAYLALLSVWEPNFLVHTVGVCLSVMVLYLLGTTRVAGSRIGSQIVLLGRYPLFSYIAQIAILQIMKRSLMFVELGVGQLIMTLAVAVALTLLSANVLELLRKKSRVIDRGYRFIFA
jgi:uncharacterized membrane protein